MRTIEVKTQAREELVDITARVREELVSSGVKDGICYVYVPHTTAAVTINENADPSVKEDVLMALRKIVPDSLPYRHSEGNSLPTLKPALSVLRSRLLLMKGSLLLGLGRGSFSANLMVQEAETSL